MQVIERLKAKLLIGDEIQKLEYLSKELKEGKSTNVDKKYWDEALSTMEGYVAHVPRHKDTYNVFSQRREFLNHTVRAKRLETYEGTLLVASALRGLFDTLRVQRAQHEQKDDIIVVMGNWMAFPGDVASIHKAMDLSQEGILFLRGATEEAYLEENPSDTPEAFFLHTLPTDVRTKHIIITTGDAKSEPMDMKEFVQSDTPNLTGKTMVFMHPLEGKDSFADSARKLIALAPGDATRLTLKEL